MGVTTDELARSEEQDRRRLVEREAAECAKAERFWNWVALGLGVLLAVVIVILLF